MNDVKLRQIRIKRSYPLNTKIEEKARDAEEFHGWSLFLNNRHNIAHVMHHEDSDGYYRLKCRSKERGLKQYSDDQLLLYFFVRLNKLLIL